MNSPICGVMDKASLALPHTMPPGYDCHLVEGSSTLSSIHCLSTAACQTLGTRHENGGWASAGV